MLEVMACPIRLYVLPQKKLFFRNIKRYRISYLVYTLTATNDIYVLKLFPRS